MLGQRINRFFTELMKYSKVTQNLSFTRSKKERKNQVLRCKVSSNKQSEITIEKNITKNKPKLRERDEPVLDFSLFFNVLSLLLFSIAT